MPYYGIFYGILYNNIFVTYYDIFIKNVMAL